jgi:oligopeptide/dipeptide ABC transporter ATP-binding protein
MCDRVAVMYAGRIVEQGSVRQLFTAPKHPYTEALLGSLPKIGSREPLRGIPGSPPNLASLPPGCSFQPRCSHAMERCGEEAPGESHLGNQHVARCWLVDQPAPLVVRER